MKKCIFLLKISSTSVAGLFDITGLTMPLGLTTIDKLFAGARHFRGGRAFFFPGPRAYKPLTELLY